MKTLTLFDENFYPAWNALYLVPLMNLHRLVFIDFYKMEEYDTFSLIDAYLSSSELREKMDKGISSALNACDKQCLNSVDYSLCKKKTEEAADPALLHWMADIYTLFQWMYSISSKEIVKRIPAHELARVYYPLHEATEKNACEKLLHIYFRDIEEKGKNSMNRIGSFREENSFLSNFYDAPVTYNRITYNNSEAAFHSQQVLTDEERMAFSSLHATEAKKLGRKVSIRYDWEAIKVQIMKDIVYAKFSQNEELGEKLIATGDAYLEEGNDWEDRVWGTVDGKGANLLGNILMEVREKLSKERQQMTDFEKEGL